nr:hypothetical protein [Acetobacter persici]
MGPALGILAVTLAALLPALPASAAGPDYRTHLAGVTPFADPRQRVSATHPPWSAIGRVQTELGARCTGFLISRVLVETAAHCLWLAKPARFVQPVACIFCGPIAAIHSWPMPAWSALLFPPLYARQGKPECGAGPCHTGAGPPGRPAR